MPHPNASRLILYICQVIKERVKIGVSGPYYLMITLSPECSIKNLSKWPWENVFSLPCSLPLFQRCPGFSPHRWFRLPSPPSHASSLHVLNSASHPLHDVFYTGALPVWLTCLSPVTFFLGPITLDSYLSDLINQAEISHFLVHLWVYSRCPIFFSIKCKLMDA